MFRTQQDCLDVHQDSRRVLSGETKNHADTGLVGEIKKGWEWQASRSNRRVTGVLHCITDPAQHLITAGY